MVLVSSGCAACVRAAGIAAELARLVPGVGVRVLDVNRDPVPAGVILVGTPMYVDVTAEPAVLALGNPTVAELERHYGRTR